MSTPVRHHVVPRFYLDRWGSGRRRVYVRRRDRAPFDASTRHVAVETGFYNVVDSAGQTSAAVEKFLNSIEGPGAEALRQIDRIGEPPKHGSEERWALASLLALQHTRSPEQRARTMFHDNVQSFLNGRELTRELVAEYLAEHHLGSTPSPNEVEAALGWVSASIHMGGETSVTQSIELMLTTAANLTPLIEEMRWTVEHDRKGRFLSSDTPLTIWRPPSKRDQFEGIGIENCIEVRIPLDPWKLLVLHRDRQRPSSVGASTERPRKCNTDLARGCHTLVFGSDQQRAMIDALTLRSKRPVLRFGIGPGYQELPDGSTEEVGEILHSWVPRD